MTNARDTNRLGAAFFAGALGYAVCACASSTMSVASQHADAPTTSSNRVIEAREIRLVDESGKLRILLTVHPGEKRERTYEDKPGMYMYGKDGTPRVAIALHDDRPVLNLRNDAGTLAACLHVTKHKGGGSLWLRDRDGHKAELGVWTHYLKGDSNASSLRLVDDKENTLWKAP